MVIAIIQKKDGSVMNQNGSQEQDQKWEYSGNIWKRVSKIFCDEFIIGGKREIEREKKMREQGREREREENKQEIGKKEDKNGYKYVGLIKWRVLSTTERNFSLRHIPIISVRLL